MLTIFLVLIIFLLQTYSHMSGQYDQITDNLFDQYRILEIANELTDIYSFQVRDVFNDQNSTDHLKLFAELDTLFERLDRSITDKETRVQYEGYKNSVRYFQDVYLSGMNASKNNLVVEANVCYDDLFSTISLIEKNAAQVILKEINNANKIQQRLQDARRDLHASVLMMGFMIFVFFVVFAFVFSTRFTSPIEDLSYVAKNVSAGRLDVKVKKPLLSRKDEIGTLSNSLSIMINSLKKKITNLKSSGAKLKHAKDALGEKFEQLKEAEKTLKQKNQQLKVAKKEIERFNSGLEDKVKARTKELEKANKKVTKLLETKNQFVNQVAHDLRTPLTPITVFLPMIKKKISPKLSRDDKKRIDIVLRNVDYLSDLVSNTLNIARLDSGKSDFTFSVLDLYDIVHEALDNNQILLKKNKMQVVNNIKPKKLYVNVDKTKMTEVLVNFIQNACKYKASKSGRIVFDAKSSGKTVTVSVADSGMGISKKNIDKVFDEFFRVDKSRHDAASSSGLGLSICKRIIKEHGGKLWVESPGLGKGSVFSFTLKLADKKDQDKTNQVKKNSENR